MSKFDELFKKKEEGPLPQGLPFYGSYYCQTCFEEVEEGEYFPTESLLVWVCDKGHKSWLEGFSIG